MLVMTESQRARFHDVLREVMADRNRFHVISSKKRWIVLGEDAEKRMGAFSSKTEAIEKARALAVQSRGDLVIHETDGSVASRESFRAAQAD